MRQFIDIVENSSQPSNNFIQHALTIAEREDVYLELYDISEKTVEIAEIRAKHQGKGSGTTVMKLICDLADEMDIELTLGVANETDDEDFSDENDLIEWYERFGFEIVPSGFGEERTYMIRTPL